MAAETKIVITAATDQADGALRTLGQSLDGLSSKFRSFTGIAGALGGALSLTAFAGFIKHSIDAADELYLLSQKTGTAVKELGGLQFAAEQNGTKLEYVANAAKKLSGNIADHPELFRKFGITAKDTTGALVQMADIFQRMPDGVEKSALAVKLMGKNGAELIPFLNQGSAALKEQVDQGLRYNPVTEESARQANKFNDQLKELEASSNKLGVSVANELLPGLVSTTSQMVEAAREGDKFKMVLLGIAGIGKIPLDFIFGDTSKVDVSSKKLIADLKAEMGQLERNKESGSGWLMRKIFGTPTEIDARIAIIKNQIAGFEKFGAQLDKKPEPPVAAPKTDGKGKALLDALGTKSVKIDPNDTAVAALQAEAFRKQMELMGVSAEQVKVYELAMKGATKAQLEQAQAAVDLVAPMLAEIEARKQLAAAHDEAAKLIDKVNTAAAEEMAQMRFDTSLLGLNTVEVQKRTEARRIDLALEKELLALRGNDKFKSRETNPAVAAEYQATEAAAKKAAAATKEGALAEIQARNEVARSWEFGSSEAIRKYIDQVSNAAAQTEAMMTNAFKGMEDALVKFVRTGKLDFKSLADNIINDLIRIQVRQSLGGMMGQVGGMMGQMGGAIGDFFTPSFAGGGYTGSGSRSGGIDGIGGFPAILHPNETVVDHSKGQSSTGTSVTVIQHISIDSRSDQSSIMGAVMRAKDMAKAEIMDSLQRGGQFAQATGRAR